MPIKYATFTPPNKKREENIACYFCFLYSLFGAKLLASKPNRTKTLAVFLLFMRKHFFHLLCFCSFIFILIIIKNTPTQMEKMEIKEKKVVCNLAENGFQSALKICGPRGDVIITFQCK